MITIYFVHEDFQLDPQDSRPSPQQLLCGQSSAFGIGVRLRINNVGQHDAPPKQIARRHLRVAPAQLAQVSIAWDVKNS